jgi:signal transduction histidine kinase
LKQRTVTWAYIGAIVLAAGGLSLFWLRRWPEAVLPPGSLPVLFLILAAFAQHFPLTIGPQRKVDASISVYFASTLLFGATTGVILVGVAQLLGQATLALRRNPKTGRRQRGVPEVVFNTSQLVLATGLGALVYYAFLPDQAPAPLERTENLWAVPSAAMTMYLANSVAVAIIVGIHLKRSPLRIWLSGRRTHTLEFAGLFLGGLLTVGAALQGWWALLAMLLLTAILFLSLRRAVQLLAREQELRVEADATAAKVGQLQGVIERERAALAAVMESMSDGLLVLDDAAQVRYCNPQAAILLNVQSAAVIGQDARSLIRQIVPQLTEPAPALAVWERIVGRPNEQPTGELTIAGPPRRDLLVSAFSVAEATEGRYGILLRDISASKQLALLEERERIAMDLHDGVTQELYGIGLVLSAQERTLGDQAETVRIVLQRVVGQIDEVIQQIRNAIFDLRPRDFAEPGLGVQLTALVAEFGLNDLLRPELELDTGDDHLLPEGATASLLQVAREAITNVVRHAGTRQAKIRLARKGVLLSLTVSDNGRGFDPEQVSTAGGQGLRNMAQRARQLGGRLAIVSAPGQGTQIHLDVPTSTGETI